MKTVRTQRNSIALMAMALAGLLLASAGDTLRAEENCAPGDLACKLGNKQPGRSGGPVIQNVPGDPDGYGDPGGPLDPYGPEADVDPGPKPAPDPQQDVDVPTPDPAPGA